MKRNYQHMMQQVKPNEQLVQEVMTQAHKHPVRQMSRTRRVLRPVAAVIAVCVCLNFTLSALAANSDTAYAVMYAVSPTLAQHFVPVNQTCDDNGIRMEVESASISGDTAQAYVTLRDMEKKGRIDETTDLMDSYSILTAQDTASGCSLVGYDKETQTARFYITIQSMNGKDLTKDKVTFTLAKFLSGKQEQENYVIPHALDAALKTPQTMKKEINGGGGDWDANAGLFEGEHTVLKPNENNSILQEIPGIDFTGVGYIDGKLHIQMAMRDFLETDNHADVWLTNANGTKIETEYNVCFISDDNKDNYYEFVFDIPRQELAQYQLCGDFWTANQGATQGNWRVTFPLEQKIQ